MTGARDKVQLIGAIVAMQAPWHDEQYGSSSIVSHPCKKRKDGAPRFVLGNEEHRQKKAGPPATE